MNVKKIYEYLFNANPLKKKICRSVTSVIQKKKTKETTQVAIFPHQFLNDQPI